MRGTGGKPGQPVGDAHVRDLRSRGSGSTLAI